MTDPRIRPETLVHSAVFPIELKNGNNGRSVHWSRSANRRKQYERYLILSGNRRTPFLFPVLVHLVRLRGPRQRTWDSDSWQRGNWKELCDALVKVGWFHDDRRRWIVETLFSEESPKEHGLERAATRIEIYKVDR